jgi:DNA repair protein RadD
MELRDYQKEAAIAGIDYFLESNSKENGVIIAPTGSGKSLIIAEIARQLGSGVLVFQPRKELLFQNLEKFKSFGLEASIYSASANKREVGGVTYATIGSVKDRPDLFKDFDYCIVDECHLLPPEESSMYQEFLSEINAKILGLTATPIRLKQYNYPKKHSKLCMLDRMKPRVFSRYIYTTQISQLVERGYFARTEYQYPDFSGQNLKLNTTGADYTEESMKVSLAEEEVNDRVVKAIDRLRKSDRKHCIVFTPTVDEAQYIAEQAGGAYIYAKTPKKERERVLKEFREGKIFFVANVGILGVGFDFPELDTIILARPTVSLAMYYQWIGRGVRPHHNKDKCLILDFAGNYKKFGAIENLKIRHGKCGWGIYSGNRLLTNKDVATPSDEFEEDGAQDIKTGELLLGFGKYKKTRLKNVPRDYLKWIWETVEAKSHSKIAIDYIRENELFQESARLKNK